MVGRATERLDGLIGILIEAYSRLEDLGVNIEDDKKNRIDRIRAATKKEIDVEVSSLRQRALEGDNLGHPYIAWAILNYEKMPFMYRAVASNAYKLNKDLKETDWVLLLEDWGGSHTVNTYTGVIDEKEPDFLLMRVGKSFKLDVVEHPGFSQRRPVRSPNMSSFIYDQEIQRYDEIKAEAERLQKGIVLSSAQDMYAADFYYYESSAGFSALSRVPEKDYLLTGAGVVIPAEILLLLKKRESAWIAENLSISEDVPETDSEGVEVFMPDTLTEFKLIYGEERVKQELSELFGTSAVKSVTSAKELRSFLHHHHY
jgi:hypothetical protein